MSFLAGNIPHLVAKDPKPLAKVPPRQWPGVQRAAPAVVRPEPAPPPPLPEPTPEPVRLPRLEPRPMPLAYRVVESLPDSERRTPPSIPGLADMIRRVAREYGTSPDAIVSRSRTKIDAGARHHCWLLLRDTLNMSYPAIAHVWGVDHTTVMYGVERARARLEASCA